MADERASSTDAGAEEDLVAKLQAAEQEIATLREQLAVRSAQPPVVPVAGDGAPTGRQRHWVRATAAAVLVTLGVMLAPVAVVAHWAQRELTDTDRYLATIGPLGSDPLVQSALENRITDEIMAKIDVPTILEGASAALDERGLERAAQALVLLEGSVTGGIESFVQDMTSRVVESDAFETAWLEANRTAHEQLIAVLQGQEGTLVQLSDEGELTIQLSGLIEQVKDQLVDAGLGVAANIPEIDASFTIVQTSELVRLRNAYNAVVLLGTWLPWLSIGLIAAGVLTAIHRSRTLMVAGLALAGSMVALGLGLTIGRSMYLNALTGEVARLDVAQLIFDQVVSFIRLSLRTVGVAGLVLALVAYLAGGSDSALALRSGLGRGVAAVRSRAEGHGVSTGPFGAWLDRYSRVLHVAIAAAAALAIFAASTLTPTYIVTVAIIAGVLVAVIELLARPPVEVAEE